MRKQKYTSGFKYFKLDFIMFVQESKKKVTRTSCELAFANLKILLFINVF